MDDLRLCVRVTHLHVTAVKVAHLPLLIRSSAAYEPGAELPHQAPADIYLLNGLHQTRRQSQFVRQERLVLPSLRVLMQLFKRRLSLRHRAAPDVLSHGQSAQWHRAHAEGPGGAHHERRPG